MVEKVVFAVFVYHSVRVVHPSVEGRKVIGGTELFTIACVERVGQFHFLAASSVVRRKVDTHGVVGVHFKFERD